MEQLPGTRCKAPDHYLLLLLSISYTDCKSVKQMCDVTEGTRHKINNYNLPNGFLCSESWLRFDSVSSIEKVVFINKFQSNDLSTFLVKGWTMSQSYVHRNNYAFT